MDKMRVEYSRKAAHNYESVGIGGMIEFTPTSQDTQKEFDENFLLLKLVIDSKLEDISPKKDADDGLPEIPDLGEAPAWVAANEAKDTPAPPAPPAPAADVRAADSPPARTVSHPDTEGIIYLEKAKVFRSAMKRDRNGKSYAELRIGHPDLVGHINNQYVTTRIFAPEYAQVVGSLVRAKNEETNEIMDVEKLLIDKGDFVNVWGNFTPWKSDETQFDLNITAIQKNE